MIRHKLKRESTLTEDMLWYAINNKQLGYKFRRQHGIINYIVDFYCPELKLVIEIDDESHTDQQIFDADCLRDGELKNLGFIIKRYYSNEILTNLIAYDIKKICDDLSGETRVPWN